MSLPNPIPPGATWLISRRCTQRQFWLAPRGPVKRTFGYLVAVLAERYGVNVHAIIVLSNHHHLLLSDPRGVLPDFLRDLHNLTARSLNAEFGRWENLWAAERVGCTQTQTAADTMAKLVYVAGNAVEAGLVEKAADWPGLKSNPRDCLNKRGRTFKRPTKFFREDGVMPEKATLVMTVPPDFAHLGPHEFADRFEAALKAKEAYFQEKMREADRSFLGVKAVRSTPRTNRPKTKEPRRKLNPRVAAMDREVRKAALARLVKFRRQHREARRAWLEGEPNVVFPAHTFLARHFPGVRIEELAAA